MSYTKGRTDNYFANFVGETGGGVETAYYAQNVIHKYYVNIKNREARTTKNITFREHNI